MGRTIIAKIVNGFVIDGQGGNPAGVVLDADDLSEEQMQQIARKIAMSETAFVSASDEAGFRFDFAAVAQPDQRRSRLRRERGNARPDCRWIRQVDPRDPDP